MGQAQGRFFYAGISKCYTPPNSSAIGSQHTALRSKWTEERGSGRKAAL